MADDIVTRLRDVVCWCNEFDGVCDACQAADEIERLQRWKVEACSVLADWDAIYVSLGDRGELGQRKSAVVAAEIERLRTEFSAVLGDAIEWCDAENERLRAAGDALDALGLFPEDGNDE